MSKWQVRELTALSDDGRFILVTEWVIVNTDASLPTVICRCDELSSANVIVDALNQENPPK